MRIAFFASMAPGRITGPSYSVTNLAKTLRNEMAISVSVFSTENISRLFIFNDIEIRPYLEYTKKASEYSLCVFAGVYDPVAWKIARFSRKSQVPYLVSSRGNLMRASLRKGAVKKLIALPLLIRPYVKHAAAIHFLSNEERNNSILNNGRSFIARNGVTAPFFSNNVCCREKLLTFVGRLDVHHKGLDTLVSAVSKCREALREQGWHVVIAGSDYRGGRGWLEREVHRLGVEDNISIMPAVFGEEKASLLQRTSIFLHPSRYEGQPQAAIEAMMYGCPVVVTPGTNMVSIVYDGKCGWVSSDNAADFAHSIQLAINSLTPDMSCSARRIAISEFNWSLAATEFLAGLEAL